MGGWGFWMGVNPILALVHGPVLALVVDLLAGPELLHHLDGLGHARDPLLAVGADGLQLGVAVAQAHAEHEAALGDVVQGGHVLRHLERVVQRQQHDAGLEPHLADFGREPRQHRERLRPDGGVRHPVLRHGDGGEAAVAGDVADLHGVVDLLVQGPRGIGEERTEIDAKFH